MIMYAQRLLNMSQIEHNYMVHSITYRHIRWAVHSLRAIYGCSTLGTLRNGGQLAKSMKSLAVVQRISRMLWNVPLSSTTCL